MGSFYSNVHSKQQLQEQEHKAALKIQRQWRKYKNSQTEKLRHILFDYESSSETNSVVNVDVDLLSLNSNSVNSLGSLGSLDSLGTHTTCETCSDSCSFCNVSRCEACCSQGHCQACQDTTLQVQRVNYNNMFVYIFNTIFSSLYRLFVW